MQRLSLILLTAACLLAQGRGRDVTYTAAQANAYFAGAGAARLPAGVSHVVLGARPGQLEGSARIDFDQLAARRPGNPLLLLFTGTHTVSAQARVDSSAAPAARLTLTQVRLDGEVIPNFLIDAAIAAFVTPKYPKIGRSFDVPLPEGVADVTVGEGKIILHYR